MMVCDTGKLTNHKIFEFYDTVVSKTTLGCDMIGCLVNGTASYGYRDGTGIHYWPGAINRTENFPLDANGNWNSNYDPTEAEEIIQSTTYTPYGIKITRTSRAWSYPGYDSFIIYDYKYENTGEYYRWHSGVSPTHSTDTLYDVCSACVEMLVPSYVYNMSKIGNF